MERELTILAFLAITFLAFLWVVTKEGNGEDPPKPPSEDGLGW